MPTALIVEDEPMANQLLSQLVQLRGYQTESAFTGGEALEIARRRRPDLVFLDLMLPDINGYEVCKALKGERRTTAIPVVIVTARVADESRVQSYLVGASDYVPKPYTPDQIFDALTAADTWRHDFQHADAEGEVILDVGGEAGAFEEISRLRSLLLDRTPLDEETVRQLGQALAEMGQNILDWGRRRRISPLGSFRYRVEPDRLVLRVIDRGGWSPCGELTHEMALGRLTASVRFDEVAFPEKGDEAVLTRCFPRIAGATAD